MRIRYALAGVFSLALTVVVANADDKKKPMDNDFVDKVSSSGRVEVELAKIAMTRATHEEVRKFAAKLAEDHSKANNDLLIVVSDERIPIPEQPLPEHVKHLQHFAGNQVKDFDKEYMKMMVENHEKSVELFTKASKECKNEKVKKFAEKTLPTIKEHLTMAKKIKDEMK